MKGVAAGERNRGCESKADMVCATGRTWLSQELVHCFSLAQRGFRVPKYHAGMTGARYALENQGGDSQLSLEPRAVQASLQLPENKRGCAGNFLCS